MQYVHTRDVKKQEHHLERLGGTHYRKTCFHEMSQLGVTDPSATQAVQRSQGQSSN